MGFERDTERKTLERETLKTSAIMSGILVGETGGR